MSSIAADLQHDEAHAHPGDRTYIKVAVLLSIITLAEVVIYYIDALSSILVPALIIMSIFKFCTVILYFMHLKFDDRRLLFIFVAAMVLTLVIVGALDALFRYHAIDYASNFLTGRETEH
jgi:cytochrome c oxidase subunit IV